MFKVMKQLLCFVLILGLAFGGLVGLVPKPSYAEATSHPIISELVDAKQGLGDPKRYDRYVEIYNPTNQEIDLTGYKVVLVETNKEKNTVELSGTLASGNAVVVAQDLDRPYADFKDTGKDHWNSFNGTVGDGAILKYNDAVVDNAVSTVKYSDKRLERNMDVGSPNSTFTESEWSIKACASIDEATPRTHESQYPVSDTKVAKVLISPETGKSFDFDTENVSVTLNCTTDGAKIFYGVVNHPSTEKPSDYVEYTGPISLTQAADVYAYATKDGMENSETTKASFFELDAKIADVRSKKGRTARVVGVVTARVGSKSIYIQDETAGIILSEYKSGTINVNLGDKVEVEGVISDFYGNAQIQPASSDKVKVVQANAGVPEAKVVTANQVNESVEGQLVTIKNVALSAKDSKGNVPLTDSTGDVKMYFKGEFYGEENHESITGVVNYHYGEHKILPRESSDLVQDSTKVERPKASMPSGGVESGTKISLTSKTDNAEIYYVVGVDKDSVSLNYGEGTLYTGAITVDESHKYIKAYAKKDGLSDSVMVEYSYTLSEVTKIHDIQGASHESPMLGESVVGVKGIVTAVSNDRYQKGFFMQEPDATKDSDDKTSEGIIVITEQKVVVGDFVSVSGTVAENKNDSYDGTLKETQLINSTVTKLGSGYDLPEPIVLGKNGRPVITDIVDNDSFKTFDPEQDAIDYYEAVEGMLVKVQQPAIVGGDERYGEIYILADKGEASKSKLSYRGGIVLTEGNFNPEVMTIDDVLVSITNTSKRVFNDHQFTPNPGDSFDGDITGVMSYGFGKYKIYNTNPLPNVIDKPIASNKPITEIVGDSDTVTVASFNVENFSKDKGEEKADAIANAVVTNMKTPDIIALIEVQDNDGDKKSDVVDAADSYNFLIERIKIASKAAGSEVTYHFTDIAPVKDTDGGIPGGNIRVGYLYNPARVSLADGEPGGATESVEMLSSGHLSKNPGRIDPMNEAFKSTRKSLVAEFIFEGESLFVITNHLSSKRGDAPTFGDTQPVVRGSEANRHKQAQVINDFVDSMLAKKSDAKIVVLGDMNDFHFSETLKVIAGKGEENVLVNPMTLLPLNKQFTYNYGGSSQVLDNILVTESIDYVCEPLSINAGFYHSQGRASDHDPVMLGVNFVPAKPSITIAEAREKAKGEEVTVKGVVQNNQGDIGGQAFTITDDTASIYIYTNKDEKLVEGDRVLITGTVDEFYGLKQIKNPEVKVLAKGVSLHPVVVTTIGEDRESELVHIMKSTVKSITTDKKSNIVITISVGDTDIKSIMNKKHASAFERIKSFVATGTQVSVTGIVKEEYSEYRLYLRGINDIGPYSEPAKSIAEVRALPNGTEVVTEGVVLNNLGVFGKKAFAFADNHSGLYVYTDKTFAEDIKEGTRIRVTGTTKEFNGLKQLDVKSITVLSQNNRIGYVIVSDKNDLSNYESDAIALKKAIVKEIIDDGDYHNGKLIVTFKGEDITCKLDSRSGDNYTTLVEKVSVGDEVDIHGIVTNYKGNYSLKLRSVKDVILTKSSAFTGVKVTDIAGQVLENVTKNDMIFIQPTMKYSEEVGTSGLLMIKLENKHNEMVRVGMVRKFSIGKDYMDETALGFDLSGLPKGEYKIKMFFWNNWNDKEEIASPFEKVLTIN